MERKEREEILHPILSLLSTLGESTIVCLRVHSGLRPMMSVRLVDKFNIRFAKYSLFPARILLYAYNFRGISSASFAIKTTSPLVGSSNKRGILKEALFKIFIVLICILRDVSRGGGRNYIIREHQ